MAFKMKGYSALTKHGKYLHGQYLTKVEGGFVHDDHPDVIYKDPDGLVDVKEDGGVWDASYTFDGTKITGVDPKSKTKPDDDQEKEMQTGNYDEVD